MVEGSSDGFELKMHLAETHCVRGTRQCGLGLGVTRRVVIYKKHGAADHGAVNGRTRLRFGQGFQMFEVARDDVEILYAAPATHVCGLFDQAAAQNAFHRPHQTAVQAVHISRYRSATEGPRRAVVLWAVNKIENRCRHGAVVTFQGHQAHALVDKIRNGDG